MDYTFEELKKQIISLDFSKANEIENLDINSLLEYIEIKIDDTSAEIDREIINLHNKNVVKFEDLYFLDEPINLSTKLIISNLHLNILKRIKSDLIKIL